jgi:hypothetical protein
MKIKLAHMPLREGVKRGADLPLLLRPFEVKAIEPDGPGGGSNLSSDTRMTLIAWPFW